MVTLQPRPKKRHPVDWVTASPLWQPYLNQDQAQQEGREFPFEAIRFRQPAILRFTSDTFMDDFLKVATTTPERLHLWRVQKETWRIPAPTPLVDLPPDDDGQADRIFAAKASGEDLTPEQKAELEELGLVKLYQPANQRFYLVTANLVCRISGLPDRMLNLSNGEQVSFVLRRVIGGKEYALIDEAWHLIADFDDERLNEQSFATLHPGEHQFPMSPVTYYAASDGHKRRMFTGLLPVSGREKFINTEINSEPISGHEIDNISGANSRDRESQVDQLVTVVDMDVLQPWEALLEQFDKAKLLIKESFDTINKVENNNDSSDDESNDFIIKKGQLEVLKTTTYKLRDQFQISSWYILLDLTNFLKSYLTPLWQAIQAMSDSELDENSVTYQLFQKLEEAIFKVANDFEVEPSSGNLEKYYALIEGQVSTGEGGEGSQKIATFLRDLTSNGHTYGKDLETTTFTLVYDTTKTNTSEATTSGNLSVEPDWPPEFLLCGVNIRGLLKELRDTRDPTTKRISQKGLIRLALEESLGDGPTKRLPLIPLSHKISQSDIEQTANRSDEDNNEFLIRCVFERPHCPPSLRQVVSQPSLKFQMASYFDPDAPARPILIPLPVDTSPAGLRKFTKNTMFAISDSLACQVELARKLTFGDLVRSVLPWPLHKQLPDPRSGNCKEKGIDIGKLCTLSIPIITICAFILLIIIVLLLDQIFKWVPYLIYCLPLPGLKAKKGGQS